MLDVSQIFFRTGVKVIKGYRNSAIYDFNTKRVFLVSKNVVKSILRDSSFQSIPASLVYKMIEYNLVTSNDKEKEMYPQQFEYNLFDDCYTDKDCTLLYVEITDKCNYHCIHCYADMRPGRCREIPIEQFTTIISNIKSNKTCDIRLTGGEPFLHSRIRMVIDLVEKNIKPNTTHSIVTNGSFQIEDALYAIEKGFEIQISIYGMNSDTFERFTNASEQYWEKVQENLKCLSVSQNKDKVLLCFAVNKLTYSEIEDFRIYAEKNGFRYIFNRPASTGRAVDNWNMLELPKEKHFEFAKKNQAPNLRCCYHLCQLHLSVVGVDGNVFPCSFLRDKSFVMGNIFESSFENIWKLPQYKKFRELNPTNVKECNGCEFIYMCTAGCCAEAVGMTGNILSVYPWCKVRPYEDDYLKISDNELYVVDKLAAGTFDFTKV